MSLAPYDAHPPSGYEEEFVCTPPPAGATYQVLTDEWTRLDSARLLRRILKIRVVGYLLMKAGKCIVNFFEFLVNEFLNLASFVSEFIV